MIAHRLGNGDSPGRGDAFETRGHVDAIAEDVAILYHNVPKVNADAEFNGRGRCAGITRAHGRLNIDGASNRADNAGKFRQHPISSDLDDPAIVLADLW